MLTISSFRVHGTVELSVQGQILVIEGEGPWNMESMQESGERFKPLTRQLLSQPWAVLVILRGQPIYVPEAAALLSQNVKRDKDNGRLATAVMLNQSATPGFGKRHITDIYRAAGETFEFFDERQDATSWLETKLQSAIAC